MTAIGRLRGALLLLMLAAAAGCGSTSGRVERGIERALTRSLGPAERYDVDVRGLNARSGEADRVTVAGDRVRVEGAPVLSRLDLELRGVRYDRDARRLDRVDTAFASVRIRPGDLAAFLEEHRNVRDASVTLRGPDSATIRLRPELGGFALPPGASVEVTGRVVGEGGRVSFDISEISAAGARLAGFATRGISDLVNPLVDLSAMPVDLQVTGVRVEGGTLRLEATGDPSGLRLR